MTTILHATTLHCAPAPPRAGSLAARRSTALGGSPSSSAALARTNPTTHRSSSVRMITMPTTRAGFLDGLLGGGKPGEKRVTRPRPGTRTVLICTTCKNKGSEMCPGCNGTCRSKVNGNVMERFKCMVCQGVGAISCSNCNRGGKGLTPEQIGER